MFHDSFRPPDRPGGFPLIIGCPIIHVMSELPELFPENTPKGADDQGVHLGQKRKSPLESFQLPAHLLKAKKQIAE